MRNWKNFSLGLIAGIALLAALVFCYFRFGLAPVSAAAAPMPLERYLARAALHSQTERAAADKPPFEPTEENLMAGARIYSKTCAVCHGQPGRPQTPIQKGMFPKPPNLLTGKGVTDDPVGETHWVVRYGIRLSGMPSFRESLTDAELWQVSLLLARAHELPPSVQEYLSRESQHE